MMMFVRSNICNAQRILTSRLRHLCRIKQLLWHLGDTGQDLRASRTSHPVRLRFPMIHLQSRRKDDTDSDFDSDSDRFGSHFLKEEQCCSNHKENGKSSRRADAAKTWNRTRFRCVCNRKLLLHPQKSSLFQLVSQIFPAMSVTLWLASDTMEALDACTHFRDRFAKFLKDLGLQHLLVVSGFLSSSRVLSRTLKEQRCEFPAICSHYSRFCWDSFGWCCNLLMHTFGSATKCQE